MQRVPHDAESSPYLSVLPQVVGRRLVRSVDTRYRRRTDKEEALWTRLMVNNSVLFQEISELSRSDPRGCFHERKADVPQGSSSQLHKNIQADERSVTTVSVSLSVTGI